MRVMVVMTVVVLTHHLMFSIVHQMLTITRIGIFK
jgi:hypothetical protein